MVAFHARLDYLSQNMLREVFVKRAQLFAHSLTDLAKLDTRDRDLVRTRAGGIWQKNRMKNQYHEQKIAVKC